MKSWGTRSATIDDADFLLKLKNDPETRKNAILTKQRIKKADHLEWLERKIADEDARVIIVIQDQMPIGTIRFNQYGNGMIEVAIVLAKEARGRGLGSDIVEHLQILLLHHDIWHIKKRLIAKIVDGNIASFNVFIKNGFKMIGYTKTRKIGYYTLFKEI